MTKASVPCRSLQKCCAGIRAQLGFLLDGRVCQSTRESCSGKESRSGRASDLDYGEKNDRISQR